MTLKNDLLSKGYFPDNLPVAYFSTEIATYFANHPTQNFLSRPREAVRAASYNCSKRGVTRRTFSVIHPVTAHDLSEFANARWDSISEFLNQDPNSLSIPRHTPDGERAIEISSHGELETVRLNRLSQYRFIAVTDISRFYHSIYTHSIPWAFHGKAQAKADRNARSAQVFLNRADQILQLGQDGQTIGIPVGPDTSRIFAEIVSNAIDTMFRERCDVTDYALLRHVDDVWIGTNSYVDAERALWRYREAIREYELDINENKTRIYSEDFRYSDTWPADIASRFESAIGLAEQRSSERIRASFEYAFSLATRENDEGILKYVIRYLDQSELQWRDWETIEPFLKRAAIHFGHTIDFVVQVIVWRQLTHEDLDIHAWSQILRPFLDRQARLGNDSEVCWAIYACIRLEIAIDLDTANRIVDNCGAMPILALLSCVEINLVDRQVFDRAGEAIALENASGTKWPIILQWISRQWPNYRQLNIENELVEGLSNRNVSIFDHTRLPGSFSDLEIGAFPTVERAIESRSSLYDTDTPDQDFGDF